MRLSRLFFCIALLAAGNVGAATLTEEFTAAGAQIPKALRALGYRELGDLDLREFVAKIPKVRVQEADGWTIGDNNDNGRISARWEIRPESLTINVNRGMWQERPKQRSVLALHEYLGVLGFEDREYWMSTEMWFLTLPETRAKLTHDERKLIERRIAQQTRIRLAEGGGAVGVGGGGEITTIFVRTERIQKQLKEFKGDFSGEQRRRALDEIFSQLEGSLTVMFTTPKRQAELDREAQRKHPAACMTSRQTCDLPPRRIVPGDNNCHCPGDDSYGVVIFPY